MEGKVKVQVNEERSFSKWFTSRKTQRIITIACFMFIPLLLLFTFTYLPFGKMVGFSFYKMKYIGERTFVGLKNYKKVFSEPEYFSSLKLSFFYMAGALVQLAISLYLATVLSFKVKGGDIFKGFMFFPYLINGIAVGFIFKFFFTRGFVFDTVLQWCGCNVDKLPYWLRDQGVNNWSLAGTSIWRYFGQNMVLFIGAIMSVDNDLYEAAMLDGCNKWQQFFYITLPNIRTVLFLNVILSITGSLSAFEPPYVITSGANGTATYFVKMHEVAHTSQKVGQASAMAVVLLIIILFATLLQNVLLKYAFRDAEYEGPEQNVRKKIRTNTAGKGKK
ncbi:MAG: sugar ABC transporter permease [Lachnospiraceae bacterium]|nr:sugar ABC transporter permease [Lachnospiraceae bacterium]